MWVEVAKMCNTDYEVMTKNNYVDVKEISNANLKCSI